MAELPTHDLATAYLHWGVVQISAANAAVIVVMVVVFVAALLVPFPHGRDEIPPATKDEQDGGRA